MSQFRHDYIPEAQLHVHTRSDADDLEAAYRRSVANLNAWRTDGSAQPSTGSSQPTGGRSDTADHEVSYRRSVESMNAWRNGK